MTQYGDRIMWWIAGGGLALLLAVVAAFVVLAALERRRERQREAEADAILLPAVSAVDERPMEEIAADGLTDEQRADAERDARLAAWLAFDERAWLRARTVEVQAELIAIERRACEQAELSADALARYTGDRDGIAGLRAALLIEEECHGSYAELIDLVNATCEWPQAWEDELDALLSEGVTA